MMNSEKALLTAGRENQLLKILRDILSLSLKEQIWIAQQIQRLSSRKQQEAVTTAKVLAALNERFGVT